MNPNIENRIRDRAYYLWENDGRPEGTDKQYWARAERELSEEGELDLSEEDSKVTPIPLQAGLPTL
jgi:hypothetical protein